MADVPGAPAALCSLALPWRLHWLRAGFEEKFLTQPGEYLLPVASSLLERVSIYNITVVDR